MKKEYTKLECSNGTPIYVGDLFEVPKHQNECCNHIVICEVIVNKTCRCGYGLHDVKTGELIANAETASYRYEK